MGRRYFCVHGHFYQPPRADPSTGVIPDEPGASPFRNWNERIFHDCYKPNAELGNFSSISLNIGPTLADWISKEHANTWRKIVDQLRLSRKNEPPNIMAQPFHHTILPLAKRLDKITQVRWGIRAFEKHFGEKPVGMWLPEMAVNRETLEVLSDHGIKFTILAPWQAKSSNLDTREPYMVKLSQDRTMIAFFYDKDLSTRISFESEVTQNADQFTEKLLLDKYSSTIPENDEIILVASDGELYGHHKPFREKFLSYLMATSLGKYGIEAIYPAKWLEKNSPSKYVKILENTSWSCEHGVQRWRGPCGCSQNGEWKAGLRIALDAIADKLDKTFFDYCKRWVDDPWEMRHNYDQVFQCQISFEEFIRDQAHCKLESEVSKKINLLLRSQLHRQEMFASCAWFFDDFERIEPQNAVRYAAQAIWLSDQATGKDTSDQAAFYFDKVTSWKTGLRADVVFQMHLEHAADNSLT